MRDLAEKYGDDRRTRIAAEATESLSEADLVQDEAVLISLTERGYVKRVAASAFRSQSRGGRGVMGHTTKDEDTVVALIPARSLDTMLFFSDRGKVYSEKVYQIPDADRDGKGHPTGQCACRWIRTNGSLLPLPFRISPRMDICVLSTVRGKVKRVVMEEFAAVRPSGLIAMTLDEGDRLGWARLTSWQGRGDLRHREWSGIALQREQDPCDGAAGRRCAGDPSLEAMILSPAWMWWRRMAHCWLSHAGGYGKQTH